MKAVMPVALPDVLALRKRTGADRWDEVWKGVLHMPPSPNVDHQNTEWELETWLRTFWAVPGGCRVYHQINVASVGGWPNRDYRIPDLVLLTPDRFHINRREYFEAAPTVVVEIHSPGDEAYDKVDFYAEIGVPEVWIIDRDTHRPEIHELAAGSYAERPASKEGWLLSPVTEIEMRGLPNQRLGIRIANDHSTEREVS